RHLPYQRHDGVRGARQRFIDPLAVEQFELGDPRNRLGGVARDDAEIGLRLRERRLDVEPRLPAALDLVEIADAGIAQPRLRGFLVHLFFSLCVVEGFHTAIRCARSSGQSAATIASSPSVSAAGPGCRISGDFISTILLFFTAGIPSHPAREEIFSGTTFFPHHDARMTSGAAAITASALTMRSFAACSPRSRANTSIPPDISISSQTQPIPEIIASSHSSK